MTTSKKSVPVFKLLGTLAISAGVLNVPADAEARRCYDEGVCSTINGDYTCNRIKSYYCDTGSESLCDVCHVGSNVSSYVNSIRPTYEGLSYLWRTSSEYTVFFYHTRKTAGKYRCRYDEYEDYYEDLWSDVQRWFRQKRHAAHFMMTNFETHISKLDPKVQGTARRAFSNVTNRHHGAAELYDKWW